MMVRFRNRRASRDRGAVLVEAVFVLPIVIFIVMGIIEFGLLYVATSTTNSATRDGVRVGSANFAVSGDKKAAADQIADAVAKDLGASTGFDTPIRLWIYKANANGFPGTLTDFASCAVTCYRYTWGGTSWTYDNGSPGWTNPSACIDPASGLNILDSIGAYLEVRHTYVTKAFGTSQVVKEHTVSRLEPLPTTQC
jgi:hypothetical protein